MRSGDFLEKRRSKRLDLSLPAQLKRISQEEEAREGVTTNVSYTGAYISDMDAWDVRPEETLTVSLSVPRDDTRDFPFSRIAGKARVVRVEKEGIALEFNEDINRLFVAA